MKQILVILLVAFFLPGCNSGNNGPTDRRADNTGEKKHQHEDLPDGLVLNNGAKWRADSSTKINVALLQSIAGDTKSGSLEAYYTTAEQLQGGLDKMIRECKMKGPDHDALHKWLEPLMEGTKELKKQTTVENASLVKTALEKQLKKFPLYFE